MGWWKVEGTENVIGDGPLDLLGGLLAAIESEYAQAFRRPPTLAEWEDLLSATFFAENEQKHLFAGKVRRVKIELE